MLFQPHEDGPLYFPTVTNITLGSHTVLDFYKQLDHSSPDQDLNSENVLWATSQLIRINSIIYLYM